MHTSRLFTLLLFIGLVSADVTLVAYWKLDENTGIYANDSSGYNNNGTLFNAVNWTTGKNYQTPYALKFDGVNQYVNISNSSSLNLTSGLTISTWINPSNFASGQRVIQKSNYNFILYASTANTVTAYITDNATNAITATAITTCSNSVWCHVVMTFTQNDSLKIYINGVISATTPTTNNNTIRSVSTDLVNIGRDTSGASYFNGTIDEVKIWNRTLSATEIMSEYMNYCPMNPIGISVLNESNTAQTIVFSFTASNTTSSFSYTTTGAVNSFTDYYCNSSFPTGAVTISISNSSFYSPRYHYPTLTYGNGYSLNAYLLPLNDQYPITTSFIILTGNSIITNALVTIQRQFSGTWTTVAQKYTDSAGSASFNLDYQTSYYILTNAPGYSTRYDYITPTSTIYYLSLISTGTSLPFWQYYNQYQAACEVTNATYPAILITCSLNDTSGHLTDTYLSVKSIGTYGSVSLCDNTTTPNNTVSCFIAAPQNKTIVYTLAARTSSDPGYITVFSDTLEYFTVSNFQNYGILPALILILTLGFGGVMLNPALGVVGAISGVWLSSIMQLVTISPAGLMGLTAVGVILVYMMRT